MYTEVVPIILFSIVIISAIPIIENKKNGLSNEIVLKDQKQISTLNYKDAKTSLLGQETNKSRKFSSLSHVEGRKKYKLKKAFLPIFIFVLIKAIILIPMALSILAFKTWNATQLSFVSFVTAAALAFWKFCTNVSHAEPPAVHQGWDLDRSDPQLLAYSGYVPY